MEAKKGKMWSFGKNDILTQSLGKAPRCGHMQGVGKFVTPSMYCQTFQRPADRERERENRLWRESINLHLEDMRNKLRKTPCHLDIASSSYLRLPVENNNALGDDGMDYIKVEGAAEIPKEPDHLKKKKDQGAPTNTASKNLPILNRKKETDTATQNKDTPAKRLCHSKKESKIEPS